MNAFLLQVSSELLILWQPDLGEDVLLVEFMYFVFTCMPVTGGDSGLEDAPLVEFMYLVSTHMPGESYSW